MLELVVIGKGLPKLNRAMDDLGKETKMHRAYRLGLNAVGGQGQNGS